jgi:hypothetical protein
MTAEMFLNEKLIRFDSLNGTLIHKSTVIKLLEEFASQKESEALLKEIDEYLSQTTYQNGKPVQLNSIGAGSILHQQIRRIIKKQP